MSSYTDDNPEQGRLTAGDIAKVFDYRSPALLVEDLADFYSENGSFTSEEFIEEYDIEPEGNPDGALSALASFGFDITAALESDEEGVLKKTYTLEEYLNR